MKQTIRTGIQLLVMVFSLSLVAQDDSHASGINVTANVQLGLPQNEFQEILSGYPAGAAVSVSTPMGNTGILRVGAEFAWNSLGDQKSFVELFDDASNIIGGDMTSSTDVRSYLGNLRLYPLKGGIRPYADVILGFRSYRSEANIEVDGQDGSYMSTDVNLADEVKSTYGYALGLNLALSRHVFVDAKMQVLRGGRVTYVDQSSLQIDTSGDINYSLEVVDTDIVVPQIGLSIFF